ncbi:MAG TPA: DUF4331 domain-containing protein [Acidimicrobiales bacterium]|nr:DUF4331 domain-containing protein [Acidimicrobiales bacterium]
MSSHREAPQISKDPVADSTDLYAFVSPDNPETVTIIANYIPLQPPASGPNFYEFGDDVLYAINIDNNGDGIADISYLFRFTTEIGNVNTFLYNTGPIQSITDSHFNRRQTYSVTKYERGLPKVWSGIPCPPCNIGPLSTPNYGNLAGAAITTLSSGELVFAGQRAEGFYVDLGAIFDLGDLRPFEQLHNTFGLNVPELAKPAPGLNATKSVNVHTIALQIPKTALTSDGSNPTVVGARSSSIGVWTTASRQAVRMVAANRGAGEDTGPWVQVSRLANPLVNEVLIPMGLKDYWNSVDPSGDKQFAIHYARPELGDLLPVLYPSAFPNLNALNGRGTARADLEAILLTGIPAGIIPGFQNYLGPTQADTLKLNMAVAPSSSPNNLGLLGGDLAGFPNGRRVFDDVVTIELRAIAGVTYALVDKSYTPDQAAGEVTDGLTSSATDTTAMGTANYLSRFPYLGTPYAGFDIPSDDSPAMASTY